LRSCGSVLVLQVLRDANPQSKDWAIHIPGDSASSSLSNSRAPSVISHQNNYEHTNGHNLDRVITSLTIFYYLFYYKMKINSIYIFLKNRKTPDPLKELDLTKKQLVYTTLIRDQNGLGFSIAGGKGCPPFKDNTEVFII